jgi:hypothetical protein
VPTSTAASLVDFEGGGAPRLAALRFRGLVPTEQPGDALIRETKDGTGVAERQIQVTDEEVGCLSHRGRGRSLDRVCLGAKLCGVLQLGAELWVQHLTTRRPTGFVVYTAFPELKT